MATEAELLPVGTGLQPDEHANMVRYGSVWRKKADGEPVKMDVCQNCRCLFDASDRLLFYSTNFDVPYGGGVCMKCCEEGRVPLKFAVTAKEQVINSLDAKGYDLGSLSKRLKLPRHVVSQELKRLKSTGQAKVEHGLWYPVNRQADKPEPAPDRLF